MKLFIAAFLSFFALQMSANAQVYTSSTSCYAYTDCFNYAGQYIGQINCQVYGAQFFQGPAVGGNSCRYSVIPYVAVSCAGYQQVTNPYTGQSVWQWQTYNVRCPGR